jgi:hypothetical protein
MTEECFEHDYEPRNPGRVSINGEITGRFDWDGYCIGSLQFSTNGPQGGGAGYGGYFQITFTNSASTCMEVAVDGVEPKLANSITIKFCGDAEMHAITEGLEFLVAKLKLIGPLLN